MSSTPLRIDATIDRAATERPDKVALIFDDKRWTYAQLRAERDRRAGVLVEAGLQPGGRVIVASAPTDEMVISFLACARAAVPMLFLSPLLTGAELTALATSVTPALALTPDGTPTAALGAPHTLPMALPGEPSATALTEAARRATGGSDEPALLRGTSGTTGGMPKLVISPHRQFTSRLTAPSWWEEPEGIYLYTATNHFTPPDVCMAFGLGATLIFTHTLTPVRLEAELAEHGATGLYLFPAILPALVRSPKPVPSGLRLTHIRASAAGLPAGVRQAVEERYGVPIVSSYSSTEGGITFEPPRGTPKGSIGVPVIGVSARIIDERGNDLPTGATGELLIRTPNSMLGYLNNPEATAATIRERWLHTGDFARRDEEGFYYIEGRRALRINVGGFKVNPEEVETVLLDHPGVREVAVTALADSARGEVVQAFVVPAEAAITASELQQFCRTRLARYKIPRLITFREALPRSPLGKVLRHKLNDE
jgi:long-chain acyl-CoA synthetase